MARNELESGFNIILQQRAAMPLWSCLRTLSLQGSNREGAAIVASFQAQRDFEEHDEIQAIAS